MGLLRAVVLAAGEGKRMCSQHPKVLHSICGRPMLSYILDSAAAVTEEVILVIGSGARAVQEAMGSRWRYVLQEQRLGTGHALSQALPLLPEEGSLLVLCGDTPLLDSGILEQLLQAHAGRAATILTTVPPDPTGYGRVIRDSAGQVRRIVEDRDASEEEKQVREINTGSYCFDLKLLKQFLPLLSTDNVQGEYYLPDLIAMLEEGGYQVGAYCLEDYRVGLGINDRSQLAQAAAILRERINGELMRQGVTMIDPAATYIDYGVKIGPDTVVWPGTVIEGNTIIGSGCRLGPGLHLRDVTLEDGVELRHAVVEKSTLETGVTARLYAHIRPPEQEKQDDNEKR